MKGERSDCDYSSMTRSITCFHPGTRPVKTSSKVGPAGRDSAGLGPERALVVTSSGARSRPWFRSDDSRGAIPIARRSGMPSQDSSQHSPTHSTKRAI
jgi:hypothetical protein